MFYWITKMGGQYRESKVIKFNYLMDISSIWNLNLTAKYMNNFFNCVIYSCFYITWLCRMREIIKKNWNILKQRQNIDRENNDGEQWNSQNLDLKNNAYVWLWSLKSEGCQSVSFHFPKWIQLKVCPDLTFQYAKASHLDRC